MNNWEKFIIILNYIVKSFDIVLLWTIFIVVTESQGIYAGIYGAIFFLTRYIYNMLQTRDEL